MDDEKIDAIAGNVVAGMTRIAATTDEDAALANVDQAFDAMLAAIAVIDDNLPAIKVDGVPERAAVDAIRDLFDTAIKPYLADALKVMQVFEKGG